MVSLKNISILCIITISLLNPSDLIAQNINELDSQAYVIDTTAVLQSRKVSLGDEGFYDSIKNIASRSFLLNQAHRLLFVDNENKVFIQSENQNIEKYFSEYEGYIINNIKIIVHDPFGTSVYDSTYYSSQSGLDKFANNLHIKSLQIILRNNLFFKSGDSLSATVLSDNERYLRQTGYIHDAKIFIHKTYPDKKVDILVISKDLFSIGANLAISDINKGNLELYDKNIFGLGQKLETNLYYNTQGSMYSGYQITHAIDNISQSFIRSKLRYYDHLNTNILEIDFSRRFYAAFTKYAGGINAKKVNTITNIVKPDTILANTKLDYLSTDIWIARSFNLVNTGRYARRTKLVVGARYLNNTFYEGPEVTERFNYQYHNNQLLLFNAAFSFQKFYRSNLIYGFGKTEDIPIGFLSQINIGIEKDEFFKRLYVGNTISAGSYFQNFGFLKAQLQLGGFWYKNNYEQVTLNARTYAISNIHYFSNIAMRTFLGVNYSLGFNRFSDEYLTFNPNIDIRGIPDTDTKGLQKFSLNSESIFFSNYYIYGFRFVGFVFADLGFIGEQKKPIYETRFFTGIGIGLRLRNENLVFKTFQIRLAFYPNLSNDYDKLYLLVSGRSEFNPPDYNPTKPEIIDFL